MTALPDKGLPYWGDYESAQALASRDFELQQKTELQGQWSSRKRSGNPHIMTDDLDMTEPPGLADGTL